MSKTHLQKFSLFVHISVVVDRFGRSLLFCYLDFDTEAISDGFMANYRVSRGGMNFSYFIELSFFGPLKTYLKRLHCPYVFYKIKYKNSFNTLTTQYEY